MKNGSATNRAAAKKNEKEKANEKVDEVDFIFERSKYIILHCIYHGTDGQANDMYTTFDAIIQCFHSNPIAFLFIVMELDNIIGVLLYFRFFM